MVLVDWMIELLDPIVEVVVLHLVEMGVVHLVVSGWTVELLVHLVDVVVVHLVVVVWMSGASSCWW